MTKMPILNKKHKICVICEGYEEDAYLRRLMDLNVWKDTYELIPVNVKSASNIPAKFQDVFQNNRYEIVLIFCDTDKYPYREYVQIKKKINSFLNKKKAADKLIIFANPCTMQIILSHFGDISLKNQGKATNAAEIEKWTGIEKYDAHERQIREICGKIYRRSYDDMKHRVSKINLPDTTSCSTNFIVFINYFENEDAGWISSIQKYLRERE